MLALLIICGAVCALIIVTHLLMYFGLFSAALAEKRLKRMALAPETKATVIVPARDEEKLLPRLLSSLDRQTRTDFHLVLVDDRSTDATLALMHEYEAERPEQVKVVSLTDAPSVANPKLSALIHGVEHAEGDILLFTDADCVVPPSWVEGMVSCFADSSVGVILGPIETRKDTSLLSIFHAFDHIFKYSYTAGCAGIGMPTGGFGNNLAIRSTALQSIGGLAAIEVTSTEDAALISEIRTKSDWKARALFSRAITVVTEAQKSWRALTEQEIRWHTGGLFSPDLQTRLSYGFIMIYLAVSVLAIPISPFVPLLWILPCISFVTMSLMAVVVGVNTSQPIRTYWLLLIPFILLSMVYNSYLTARALLRPGLVWKGTRLKF